MTKAAMKLKLEVVRNDAPLMNLLDELIGLEHRRFTSETIFDFGPGQKAALKRLREALSQLNESPEIPASLKQSMREANTGQLEPMFRKDGELNVGESEEKKCADCEINGPVNCTEHGKRALTTDDTGKVLLTQEQWEEAQRDKARLDWLEKVATSVVAYDSRRFVGNLPLKILDSFCFSPSHRQAIDSAMGAETKGTSA